MSRRIPPAVIAIFVWASACGAPGDAVWPQDSVYSSPLDQSVAGAELEGRWVLRLSYPVNPSEWALGNNGPVIAFNLVAQRWVDGWTAQDVTDDLELCSVEIPSTKGHESEGLQMLPTSDDERFLIGDGIIHRSIRHLQPTWPQALCYTALVMTVDMNLPAYRNGANHEVREAFTAPMENQLRFRDLRRTATALYAHFQMDFPIYDGNRLSTEQPMFAAPWNVQIIALRSGEVKAFENLEAKVVKSMYGAWMHDFSRPADHQPWADMRKVAAGTTCDQAASMVAAGLFEPNRP